MPTVTGFRYSFRNSIGNRRAFRDYAFFSRVPHFRTVVTKQETSPFYARFDLCQAETGFSHFAIDTCDSLAETTIDPPGRSTIKIWLKSANSPL